MLLRHIARTRGTPAAAHLDDRYSGQSTSCRPATASPASHPLFRAGVPWKSDRVAQAGGLAGQPTRLRVARRGLGVHCRIVVRAQTRKCARSALSIVSCRYSKAGGDGPDGVQQLLPSGSLSKCQRDADRHKPRPRACSERGESPLRVYVMGCSASGSEWLTAAGSWSTPATDRWSYGGRLGCGGGGPCWRPRRPSVGPWMSLLCSVRGG